MHKRFWVAMLTASLTVGGLVVTNVAAVSSNIVISQVQLGTTTSASNEFIEIYNNATTDTEITNWCLYYASASSTTFGSKLTCFTPENDLLHIYLPAHSSAFVISTVMAANNPTLGSDAKFSATLSGTAGHVRLVSDTAIEIDKVGWGTTAVAPEALPAATAPNGKVIQRKLVSPLVLKDTDNNSLDFELVAPRTSYLFGTIYEVQDLCSNIDGIQQSVPSGLVMGEASVCMPLPVDVCLNIDGLQTTIPDGYGYDDAGLCQVDVCSNIDGLQLVLPDGKDLSMGNNCIDHDYCLNVDGIQVDIPEGYTVQSDSICLLDLLPIKISELLPNAVGDDTGHEFVELYNPNDSDVDLSEYRLYIGSSTMKIYSFPTGSIVAAHSYFTVSNDDIHFTLVNTNSTVQLKSSDGQVIDESVRYSDAAEGMAWAIVAGTWQYTDQPTPGKANLPSAASPDDSEEVVTGLKPCAPNQYRNPETNRCRLVVTIGSTLAACKTGQYRSEETNRCRSISADVVQLTPCNANQERNPDTNRCRQIVSVDTSVAPCKENQERNPDTNRCRTVVTSVPDAPFAAQPVTDTGSAFVGWWALGGVGLLALAYAGWEWRFEIVKASKKVITFFHRGK